MKKIKEEKLLYGLILKLNILMLNQKMVNN